MTLALRMAEWAVAGLWQGLMLMAVVALALRMLPRLGAAVRFAVWVAAFAAAMTLPLLRLPGYAGAAGESVQVASAWGVAIAACWAALMVWRLARLAGQAVRLRQISREAHQVKAPAEIDKLLGTMPRKPVLAVSPDVDAPSVIGFFSPKVLIPDWQIGALGEDELRQIVLHECEHLRRRDDWINLAQKIGLALFPLNPALLWADRRLSLEREMACDAGVVARTKAPYDYAACLTRLAEQRLGRGSLALALSAWAGESELGRRVHRLLRPVDTMRPGQRRLSVAMLALAVAGGSLEMARAPRLVSFADGASAQMASGPGDAVEHVPLGPVGRMTSVVYREPVRTTPTVFKTKAVGKRARRHMVKGGNLATLPKQALVARQPIVVAKARVMLTSSEFGSEDFGRGERELPSAEPVRVHLLDAVQRVEPGMYAAVPFANGWLILQL